MKKISRNENESSIPSALLFRNKTLSCISKIFDRLFFGILMHLDAKWGFVFINKFKQLLNNLTACRNPAGCKNDNIDIDDHQY